MKKLVILYENKDEFLKELIEKTKGCGFKVEIAKFADLTSSQLHQATAVVNALGEEYYESKLPMICDFIGNGGAFINLGGAPFSVPKDRDRRYPEVKKGLRALDIGDSFTKIPLSGEYELRLSENVGKNSPLRKNSPESEKTDILTAAYSGLYCLSHQLTAGRVKHADLTVLAELYDENGDIAAAPAVGIKYIGGGTVFLIAADAENLLDSPFITGVYRGIVEIASLGDASFILRSELPRYLPDEEPAIYIGGLNSQSKVALRFNISVCDQSGAEVFGYVLRGTITTKRFQLPKLPEGDYTVTVDLERNGESVYLRRTGFVVISDSALLDEVKKYERIKIDPEVSKTLCVQGGKPVLLHGTTYFVTDVWQNCFTDFNYYLCRRDLEILKRDGYNILRSGNWVRQTDFHGPDGKIETYSRRALQAYFLTAARNGLSVQFTLGHIALNDWDRSKCAIHNPENIAKVKNLVKSFAKLFGEYPNVMLDILNEPSYSYKGMWQRCLPSGDPYELSAWNRWLEKKYKTASALRIAWGENSKEIPELGNIPVPQRSDFGGAFDRTEHDRRSSAAADFWQFAQESFDNWLGMIRKEVGAIAPETVVIMGRDETLRVPMEQNGAANGHIDMVSWHQWHYDEQLHQEYMLNRIKNRVCCAQELGIYRFIDPRGSRRLSDENIRNDLERKLMFGFGNWIQWQSYSDPDRDELCENMLGVYRSDRSFTPAVPMIRELINAENSALAYMTDRDEEAFPIITLYPTSSHYSMYSQFALSALRKHIDILNRDLRLQSDLVPENLFDQKHKDIIGNPKLIIIPGAMRLSESCWQTVLEYVRGGASLLISGCVDENSYFEHTERIGKITRERTVFRPCRCYERITIDGSDYVCCFKEAAEYAEVENVLSVAAPEQLSVTVSKCGKGKIIYSPLPLELSSDGASAKALYRYAVSVSGAENTVYETPEGHEAVLIQAIKYSGCTEYTLINDGPDDDIELKDLRSGKSFKAHIPDGRSVKLWVSPEGETVAQYGLKD